MSKGLVTVFGGSGFIGRHTVRVLIEAGWRVRVAVRRPNLAGPVALAGLPGWVDSVQANIRDKASVAAALSGADAAVNLVGILYERNRQDFGTVQRDGAINIARACADAGIVRLIHLSAIGAGISSRSIYAKSKGEAEQGVRDYRPQAVILRPSIVFGPEDDFFNRFAAMAAHPLATILPFLPAIGGGRTKVQPVYAGNVAQAIAVALESESTAGKIYELGGPQIYTFRQIYALISQTIDRRRYPAPVPFGAARLLGVAFGFAFRYVWPLSTGILGGPPLTGDQVELLKTDNVVSDGALTFADLGIKTLAGVETVIPRYLWRFRPYGQYHQSSS